MKKVSLLIIFTFIQICHSQGLIYNPVANSPITNIVTPEVNNILRYQDFPNVGFIGGADINIPIYEIEYDGLSIPISLSYNTKGAKVADIASNVGLGWTLNAGGNVTIDINERYDFSANFKKGVNGGMIISYNTLMNGSGIYGQEYKPNNNKPLGSLNYQIDAAPDYYYVSAPGLNDKFYLSKINNSFEIRSLQNFKTSLDKNINESNDFDKNNIEFDYNAEVNYIPKGFDIRNENGFLYSFRDRTLKTNSSLSSSIMPSIYTPSSWLLSSIKSPTNKKDKIDFFYESFENKYKHTTVNSYQRINTGSIIISKIINSNPPPNNANLITNPELEAQLLPPVNKNVTVFNNSQRITSIIFPKGSVNFIYGDSRLDYDGKVLSRIIVKDMSGKEIKYLDFYYSYFRPIDSNCSGVYNCLRLKLDKIYDSSLEGNYDFFYGGMQPNDNLFPSRGSGKVDFLGYYNNNSSTNDLGCISNCFSDEMGIMSNVNEVNIQSTNKIYFYPNLTRDYFIPFKLSNYVEESITGVYEGSSSTKSLLGLLTSIRYPTKGGLKIEYENDDFEYMGIDYLLGSARIKSMEYFDSKNERLRKINYFYKRSNQSSSGEICFLIPPTDILRGEVNTGYKNSVIVGYSRIIQEEIGNGKIEKYYSNFSSYPDINEGINPAPSTTAQINFFKFFKYPGTFIQKMDLRRGQLIKEIIYNQNSKIKEDTFEYLYHEKNSFETSKKVFEHTGKLPRPTNIFEGKNKFINYQSYLSKQITEEYFNGDIIKNEHSYKYNQKDNLLASQKTENSKGETITTEYQYPPDLVTGYTDSNKMSQLVLQNRISEPVITKQKVGNTYISEIHNQYAEFNGIIQKSVVHQKKGSGIDINKTDDRKVIYNSYDGRGNLTQYTLENSIPVSIIWGYKGQYPIAKIEGSTNTELSNYIQLVEGNIQSNNDTYKLIFEKIREHFPNSMITTYLYKPLIGVISITAPNGQTEYYNYDAANRLQSIVNDKNEVIKTFEYNYKN
ncbi:hypothetical protein [Empedobacter brevis]|uniref:hypothetical protein n=1 Tax=Empedobacter brevis TaxID=247 RepID=UPI002FDF75E8